MNTLQREEILQLVPHQYGMCLWDAALDWSGERIVLESRSHLDPENPLRSDGQLRALHLCEYGAQAMAVHGGVLARERGERAPPGMLVALRGVQLHVTRVDDLDGPLHCEATVLAQTPASQQYGFVIRCGDTVLAEGRAAVMLGLGDTLPAKA